MSLPVVRMSVRAVVETTLHEKNLKPGAISRMMEGAAAHKARQADSGEMDYRSERALSADYESDTLVLHVTGRADGLFTDRDGKTVIEEIKLCGDDVQLVPAHRAQAAMYGHMLCAEEGLDGVRLRVLYVDGMGHPVQMYEEEQDAQALKAEFCGLCAAAAAREAALLARRQKRDAALAALPFPYREYREGQRKFAAHVYVAIRDRKRLFAQAPTGIGKTMAALYPALRALGEGKCSRVLFVTARTTGRKSAMDALGYLEGIHILAVEIAAKEKVCPFESCMTCPWAKGFYDRLPQAMEEAQEGCWGRAELAALAEKHRVCPFELSLELAAVSDVVVCDYNYVYDPFAAEEALLAGGAALLVDEAHQLGARVQDGRSAEVSAQELRAMRRDIGKCSGRKTALYRALTNAIRILEALAGEEAFEQMNVPPDALNAAMDDVLSAAWAQREEGRAAAETMRMAEHWRYAAGHFAERYAILANREKKRVQLMLLCAAPEILEKSKKTRGTVYFSATLAPFDAAQKMLGARQGDACLSLPSPFHPEQLSAQIVPIDIRYAVREKNAPLVAQAIAAHIEANPGNTLVFFPSYAYREQVAQFLPEGFLKEARGMSEDEKNALLGAFLQDGDHVILGILGGAFSEGIDLAGDRLKNVIVVSIGLPQPDERVRAMQRYYDAQGEDGFFLCMTLPGLVRIVQAAGRLIRTPEDTGTVLLIDRRFEGLRPLMEGTLLGDALKRV